MASPHLERLKHILIARQHLRQSTLLTLLRHAIHRFVHTNSTGQRTRLDAAHQLLTLTDTRLEEVGVSDFASTLADTRLSSVWTERLEWVRIERLVRKHQQNGVLFQHVNLCDALNLQSPSRFHRCVLGFAIAHVHTSIRPNNQLASSINRHTAVDARGRIKEPLAEIILTESVTA